MRLCISNIGSCSICNIRWQRWRRARSNPCQGCHICVIRWSPLPYMPQMMVIGMATISMTLCKVRSLAELPYLRHLMISHICSIQTPSDRIASSPHLIKWGGGIVNLGSGRKNRLTFLKAAWRRKIWQGHFSQLSKACKKYYITNVLFVPVIQTGGMVNYDFTDTDCNCLENEINGNRKDKFLHLCYFPPTFLSTASNLWL